MQLTFGKPRITVTLDYAAGINIEKPWIIPTNLGVTLNNIGLSKVSWYPGILLVSWFILVYSSYLGSLLVSWYIPRILVYSRYPGILLVSWFTPGILDCSWYQMTRWLFKVGWFSGWLVGWFVLVGWLVRWLFGWLVGWSVFWLVW